MVDFDNKKILLLGFGKEGLASYYYFKAKYPNCKILIADRLSSLSISEDIISGVEEVLLGDDWLNALPRVDVVMRSPGISLELVSRSLNQNEEKPVLTSATEIFLTKHRDKTIGVTGTKGKSTTSSLIKEVLTAAGKKVQLVGNIGLPALACIDETPDYFLYELSSYQLDNLAISPHIALFLNIYPEHLDYHGCFENYLLAKSQIVSNQTSRDFAVISRQVRDLFKFIVNSELILYDESVFKIVDDTIVNRGGEVLLSQKYCKLRGSGNLKNVLAVFSLADKLKLDLSMVNDVISKFSPLPHRLELVGKKNNLVFINDSISTVPQATINALDAFRGEVRVLILGGFDRGLDFHELVKEVLQQNIDLLILFKPSGVKILEALKTESEKQCLIQPEVIFINSMEEVNTNISTRSFKEGVCLLSPASPSFGLFKNFEERGERFRDLLA